MKIAALYVEKDGCYFGLDHVDPWDRERDARGYAGPHPVVAHPPCERWGHFWYGGLMLHKQGKRKIKGDDGGCFAAALAAVHKFGGVIEHPRGSAAWAHFGIPKPPAEGGWISAPTCTVDCRRFHKNADGLPTGCLDFRDGRGWTCCVYQGSYGHPALKPTWLYYVGSVPPPQLRWGRPAGDFKPVSGRSFRSKAARDAAILGGWKHTPRLSSKVRAATTPAFRDLLINIAVGL